jgi:hypothetical protein
MLMLLDVVVPKSAGNGSWFGDGGSIGDLPHPLKEVL